MTFIPRPRRNPIGFNLTPMIDVTFQLLIFFVCANTWSHVDAAEELELPQPIRSSRDLAVVQRPRVTINLRPDGTLVVSGKTITPDSLAEQLRREHARHGEQLEVVLRAHRRAPYALTQEVLHACTAAGIREVRFAVLKENGGG
jgi:biopolymer transport protein ExbD